MTFEEASLLPRSEKVSLAVVRASKIVKLFDSYSGNTYSRSVEYWVESVKNGNTNLSIGSNKNSLTNNQFIFVPSEMKLYINVSTPPEKLDISITYKIFLSNAPLILPHDLSTGDHVEWLPYIELISNIGQQLDDDNSGIVLESQSTLTLINNDGYFDEIFDTLIWENKQVDFYSWFPITSIGEAKKIFSGVIETKDFAIDKITFRVVDFVYKLRNFVKLDLFSELDGNLSDSLLNTPKRRIYGQVKQIKLSGIDKTLKGYNGTGSISIDVDTNAITGTGTLFLSELSVGDELILVVAGEEYKYGIDSILSNTSATTATRSRITILNEAYKINPEVPYRNKNRSWHLSGHKIREPITNITQVLSNNRFRVSSVVDMFAGDRVFINSDLVKIRRIVEDEIVTDSAVSPIPVVGNIVKKLPIQNIFFGNRELVYQRDWDYTNNSECKIQINNLAEFNISQERTLDLSIEFTNGSRSLTTSDIVDFKSILKPRDWIRKSSVVSGENDFYEILDVKEQEIILRTNFTGITETTQSVVKIVEYINDDSLITANCLGIEVDGQWVKTPSQAVRHLLLNDCGFSFVNEESFNQAVGDCDFVTSIFLPESSSSPQVREVITKINESCFGSLYGNSSSEICYSILNSNKPDDDVIIKDDDIISFSAESSTDIYNNIEVKYRPFTDVNNGSSTFEVVNYNSGFVDKYVGIDRKLEKTIYLYEDDKAEIIAQRYALFKSLTNTKLTLRGKMLFFLNAVNDKIFINLDRLYKRFGGADKRKIGIITGIKKSQTEVEVAISDMGNIFNRVPSIAPNVANDFLLADNNEKVKWGYIVDNDTSLPSNNAETYSQCNIIG